jgi:hypothetical protein
LPSAPWPPHAFHPAPGGGRLVWVPAPSHTLPKDSWEAGRWAGGGGGGPGEAWRPSVGVHSMGQSWPLAQGASLGPKVGYKPR